MPFDWLKSIRHRLRYTPRTHRRICITTEHLEIRELLSATPVIIDNGDPGYYDVRTWTESTTIGHAGDQATASSTTAGALASWTFSNLDNGQYYLQATWIPAGNNATNATFTARSEFGASGREFTINQRLTPTSDDVVGSTPFQTLGVVTIREGSLTVELTNSYADGNVVADAVRLEPVAATDNSVEVRTERLDAITKGLFAFQDVYGHLPPVATPLVMDANGKFPLSWRVHLLPFLGYDDLYRSFHLNEPWNSPHNLALLPQMPDVFRSLDLPAGSGLTGFQRIDVPGGFHLTGAGGPNLNSQGITDNPATTLLLLELSADKALPWTAPDDTPYSPLDPLASISPTPNGFILAAMADGKIQRLNRNISAADFHALVTWNGKEILSANRLDDIFLPSTLTPDQISQNNLRTIYFGLLYYANTYGSLPPWPLFGGNAAYFDSQGNPYLSWRVHILPFIGEMELYRRFHLNEPWDSPHNLPLAEQMPLVFRSVGEENGTTLTGYQVLAGPESYGPYNNRLSLYHVLDGFADTLAIVELPAASAATWTDPAGDVHFNSADPLAGVAPIPSEGLWVAMFDGSIHRISPLISAESWSALATWNGEETVAATELASAFLDYPLQETLEGRRLKLEQLGRAFYSFYNNYSSFPVTASRSYFDADGNPFLSWRVHLLPYLGYSNLYNQFRLNEPWNSPNNLPLLDKMPEIFRTRGLPVGTNLTGIQLLTGPDAYLQRMPNPSVGRGPTFFDNFDGPPHTLLALETQASQAVEWTRPDGDIPFNLANPLENFDLSGLENVPADGLWALMLDSSVRLLKPSISQEDFASLATWHNHEVVDAEQKGRSFFDFGGTLSPQSDQFSHSKTALRTIGIGLHSYHDIYGAFPIPTQDQNYFDASGKPYLSWRVHLLPYLDETNLYYQFHLDEPWDSPNNLPLLDKMPEIFLSRGLSAGTNLTGFQFISGPEAYQNDSTHSRRLAYVIDGTSKTIGLIETPPELAVPWSKPDDFPFDPADPFADIRALVSDYIAVMTLNTGALAISPNMAPADAAAMITWAGGEFVPDPYSSTAYSLTPQIQLTDSSSNRYRIETDVADLGSTTYPAELLKTFTIKNTGSQPLVISSVQLPNGFTLVSPLNTISPGASAPFTIRLDGSVGGNFGGLVTINSNVPDQPSLRFSIEGTVDSPLSLALSNSSIGENLPAGTVVGTFSTTDPNPGGTFLYSLVSGLGSNDNSLFTIDSAGRLKPSISFDYEAHATYSIRTRTTRQGGGPALEQTFSISIIDLNDAPVLNNAGNPTLDPLIQNQSLASNNGTLVADIIAGMSPSGGITDPDLDPLGIAVNGVSSTYGSWQYTVNNGTNWTPIAVTGNSNALLLAADANTRVRFLPNTNFIGQARFAFVAWDRTIGANGGTANVAARGGTTPYSLAYEYASINVVNVAPVLDPAGSPTLDTIVSNLYNVDNPGTLVSDIIARMAPSGGITDANPGSLQGIAINGLLHTDKGSWQFTTNGGTSWISIGTTGNSDARLLAADANTRIRFVPIAGFAGTASFAFVAWDRTSGFNGGITSVGTRGGSTPYSLAYDYASISVVNAAPVLNDAGNPLFDGLLPNTPAASNPGTLVSALIARMYPAGGITDANPGALRGIAIIGKTATANGTWEYSTNNGTTWLAINATGGANALLLASDANTRVRYRPNPGFRGEAKIAFAAWDQMTGSNGATANASTRGGTTAFSLAYEYASLFVNTAPTLDASGTPTLDPIPNTITDLANVGTSVNTILNRMVPGGITDPDPGALRGMAIVGLTGTANGTWQYTTDNGTSWSNILTTGSANALLLSNNSNTKIRFVPNSGFTGTASIAFVAWDQTQYLNGSTVNAGLRGGPTPFSLLYDYASITVT